MNYVEIERGAHLERAALDVAEDWGRHGRISDTPAARALTPTQRIYARLLYRRSELAGYQTQLAVEISRVRRALVAGQQVEIEDWTVQP